jgi:hypothetical protein
MRCIALVLTALPLLAVGDFGDAIPRHLTHSPHLWRNAGRPDPSEKLTLTFALKQQNLDVLERKFWEVSDPDSNNWGDFLSFEELTDLVRPHPVALHGVTRFLERNGVERQHHRLGASGDFLEVTIPVRQAEEMLKTTFNVFEHRQQDIAYVRATKPHGADEIRPFVDFIGGLTHLPDTVPAHDTFRSFSPAAEQKLLRAQPESVSRRRLDGASRIYNGKTAPNSSKAFFQMANPLAWRGTNLTVMTFLRCKDGSLPKAAYDCPQGQGLRTLEIDLTPDDKTLTPISKHYTLDGNNMYADVKDGKYVEQLQIEKFCRPCTQMPTNSRGVDTYDLCHQMVSSLGIHPFQDVLTCLFTFPAADLVGKSVTLSAELFFEHDSPEPASYKAACPPGMSDFACTHRFTPQPVINSAWLHKFYSIPSALHGTGTLHGNAMASVNFLGEGYDPADLSRFFTKNGVPQQAVAKMMGKNSGGAGSASSPASQSTKGAAVSGHDTAVVELEVMMSVAPLVPMWYWSVPGRRPSAAGNNEPFLRWLLDVANTKKPPLVHSVSYSDDEGTLPHAYSDRLNTEFMKAALRGITILFSSGVDGAGGVHVRDIGKKQCKFFRPQFPSSSPYITSVGSTAIRTGADGKPEEIVCDSGALGVGVTSGGGFSNRYLRPLYQAQAVKHYLTATPQPKFANPNGTSKRGYPDLAAVAPAFQLQQRLGRTSDSLGGTSAATPTVAAMIALLNDVRLAGGLPPLGFVNPLFYSLASSYASNRTVRPFRDITHGENGCSAFGGSCCAAGFNATDGWDASTGVGSPNFAVISGILGTYLGACLGMDCGGGTCSRGVCICNDGFHRNAAGRCIALAPFPLKALLTACGAIVGLVTLCIMWKSCCDGSGDKKGRGGGGKNGGKKKKGFFYQLRKTIFPYKFVIVKAKDKKKKMMSPQGASAETQPIMNRAPMQGGGDDYSYTQGGGGGGAVAMGDDYNYGDDAI